MIHGHGETETKTIERLRSVRGYGALSILRVALSYDVEVVFTGFPPADRLRRTKYKVRGGDSSGCDDQNNRKKNAG